MSEEQKTKLKAYKVHCNDDGHGAIVVFAERFKDVDKRAHCDVCDCEYIERLIHRAPEFDDLANVGRSLTPKDYLERGWYWGCSGCHKEMIHLEDNPLFVEDRVFCNRGCVEQARERWNEEINSGKAHESVVEIWTLADTYLKANPQ